MVTMNKVGSGAGRNIYELYGLSSDEKPTTDIGNGSLFLEMDTACVFIFDAENKVWLQL